MLFPVFTFHQNVGAQLPQEIIGGNIDHADINFLGTGSDSSAGDSPPGNVAEYICGNVLPKHALLVGIPVGGGGVDLKGQLFGRKVSGWGGFNRNDIQDIWQINIAGI